ncbi:MAG: hypothetical protein RI964_2537 [Pseudomonadota bacterium]|jgi:Zn-dependent peptidase ImmA (M78 family)/transcriptional regulator with XRE-family HTH domain
MFNGKRLTLARKRRGVTKRTLAAQIEMTERSLSSYENGKGNPEEKTLIKIAKVLDFPLDFFLGDNLEELSSDVASFRAMSKMTASQRDMALSAGTLALLLNNWIEKKFDLPKPNIPDLDRSMAGSSHSHSIKTSSDEGDVDSYPSPGKEHSPEAIAEALRKYWGLGELPIKNMIDLLESKGIRVFSLVIDAKEVDAFSMWYNDKPFIFLNTMKTAERCRFDAAHELGHLIMHRHGVPQGQDAEREANSFASAFLMPRRSVLAYAPRSVTLPSLIARKKYWTVSAAALNYRLHQLGLTTDWTYRTLCVQLSEFGRDKEPEGEKSEKSQVLTKVFSALRSEGVNKYTIAQELLIHPKEIDELTFGLMINVLDGGRTDNNDKRSTTNRVNHLKLVK